MAKLAGAGAAEAALAPDGSLFDADADVVVVAASMVATSDTTTAARIRPPDLDLQ